MTDEENKPPVIAVPWWKSRIMQGLMTVFVAQSLNRIAGHFHIDFSIWSTSVADLVEGITDAISLAALSWAGHARVSSKVPLPPVVTLTKDAADKENAKMEPAKPPFAPDPPAK